MFCSFYTHHSFRLALFSLILLFAGMFVASSFPGASWLFFAPPGSPLRSHKQNTEEHTVHWTGNFENDGDANSQQTRSNDGRNTVERRTKKQTDSEHSGALLLHRVVQWFNVSAGEESEGSAMEHEEGVEKVGGGIEIKEKLDHLQNGTEELDDEDARSQHPSISPTAGADEVAVEQQYHSFTEDEKEREEYLSTSLPLGRSYFDAKIHLRTKKKKELNISSSISTVFPTRNDNVSEQFQNTTRSVSSKPEEVIEYMQWQRAHCFSPSIRDRQLTWKGSALYQKVSFPMIAEAERLIQRRDAIIRKNLVFHQQNPSSSSSPKVNHHSRGMLRVACAVTGLMRSYQEVGAMLHQVTFNPTHCDIFISTGAVRGFSQLRYGYYSDPYPGVEYEIMREIIRTFHQQANETNPSVATVNQTNQSRSSRLRYVNVEPFNVTVAQNFATDANKDSRVYALPIYRHMLMAFRAIERYEVRFGQLFDVIVQLRPDLTFRYPSPLSIVHWFPAQGNTTHGTIANETFQSDNQQADAANNLIAVVRDGQVVPLYNNTLVAPTRHTMTNRVNDYLTIGLRAPMKRFLQSYYFVMHVATNSTLHSEAGKQIVLKHLNLSVCAMTFRVHPLKIGAQLSRRPLRLLKDTNTQYCFRNCSWVSPVWCRASNAHIQMLTMPCDD